MALTSSLPADRSDADTQRDGGAPTAADPAASRVVADVLTTLALATIGWAAVWVLLELGDLVVGRSAAPGGDPEASAARAAVGVVGGLAATAVAWRGARSRWRSSADSLVLASAGVVLAGAGTAALHGTRWGFNALYSDAGFRTEAVTRFADSARLADYAYRDLPSYYPPLLPWLQGRAADLVGVPGWAMMKPAQLLTCLIVPLLSWLLWRRVVPGRAAAWVAAVVAVATALPLKPDEWLVLTLAVPWWLEVCRGVRLPGRRRVGAVRQGLVLGCLLLTHTYFFAPLALATLAGMAVDLVRRRTVHPRVGPGLVTALVAVVVAAPSWIGQAGLRVRGAPSDDLQLRWSPLGFDPPPVPWPVDARGVLEAAGVLWLLWAVRRDRLAEGLLVALGAAYLFCVGGQLLQPGVAVLPEKTDELVEALLAASGVLAVAEVLGRQRSRLRVRPTAAAGAALAVVACLAVVGTAESLDRGVARPASAAQHVRYPDGRFPAGGPTPPNPRWHAWGVEPGRSGASVATVAAAWQRLAGSPPGPEDVVASARADLAATVPVHLFVSWKSIYSHPQGRFAERLAVMERTAGCASSACAHAVLTDNDVEPVDGLVLNRDERGLYLSVAVDTFPEAWVRRTLRFDDRLFEGPGFVRERVDGGEVVVLQDG
ncbi:arabinofuranosyltransferase [Nocardioides aurantiacus]|uniref:arabinofuranosyltransferase n=1 Tax=Nocardioides aurantiacus TaxID=86796 RepID=UPI00403F42D5